MAENSAGDPTGWEIDGRVERLVATALHDIRNPLNAASLLAQLLVQQHGKNMAAEPMHIASEIPRQLTKARKVLDGIASFISILSTPAISDFVPLEDALDSAMKSLEPEFRRCNGRVEREALPKVRGNGRQLGEVFKQILSNALRFSGRDVVIRITCLSSKSGFIISFRDSGLGFETTEAVELFEPFKRFHDPETSGAGLGLAICREVLSRHGGRIWAESKLGEGSVFHLEFPPVTSRVDPAEDQAPELGLP